MASYLQWSLTAQVKVNGGGGGGGGGGPDATPDLWKPENSHFLRSGPFGGGGGGTDQGRIQDLKLGVAQIGKLVNRGGGGGGGYIV